MTPQQKHYLLSLAKASIEHGLKTGQVMPVESTDPELDQAGASFVTLNLNGELRGCIGTLLAHRPLHTDIVENAYNAAFKDPRFPPVSGREFPHLDIHISLLSKPESMLFDNESDLLQQLRPGIDGLVIQDGFRRATFLPQVWEALPQPREFLQQLKRKAGFSAHYWSPTLTAERYTVESIP